MDRNVQVSLFKRMDLHKRSTRAIYANELDLQDAICF